MQQPPVTGVSDIAAPQFYITGRQRLGPGAILLGTVLAAGALASVLYGLRHNGGGRFTSGDDSASRSGSAAGADSPADDKDDPSQIDTIVVGDPADPPVPARPGEHVSPVHPTILVRLPRFGDEVGMIPNTPAGRLLYAWLAAFNQANQSALGDALPTAAARSMMAAQMELRKETGGFSLISAKEVRPGLVVFRLHDQTPVGTEALGALQVHPKSSPAEVATFSLGSVSQSR